MTGGVRFYKRLRHVRDYPQNGKFEIFHQGSLLHLAAVTGSAKCARVLLDAGVPADACDSEGRTPTMLAAIGGKKTQDVLNLLPEPDLSSELAVADLLKSSLQNDDVTGVQTAIQNGASPSNAIGESNACEWTPLISAACRGSVSIMQVLVDAGARLDQMDWPSGEKRNASALRSFVSDAGLDCLAEMQMPSARTALGWAAMHGQVDSLRWLIKAGASLHETDILEFNALHLASLGDHLDAAKYLIDLGMDLHAEGFGKRTPLHVAAEANATRTIPVLIAAGADTTQRNRAGESPYLSASECSHSAACRLLKPHSRMSFRLGRKSRKRKRKLRGNGTEANSNRLSCGRKKPMANQRGDSPQRHSRGILRRPPAEMIFKKP